MLQGCWQRALLPCCWICHSSPSWSSALDYKGIWVWCLPSGSCKAWDEVVGVLWIGFTGRVLHSVHLCFGRQKNTCLKPFPKLKTMECKEWFMGSSPVSGCRISYACTGCQCCSLQHLVLPVRAQQQKGWLACQTCFLSPVLLGSLWLTSVSVLVLLVVVTLWTWHHLLAKALLGSALRGRVALGSSAGGVPSCINGVGNPSLLGHVCRCLS